MIRRAKLCAFSGLVVALVLAIAVPRGLYGQTADDKKKEELLKKIEELQNKKRQLELDANQKINTGSTGESQEATIKRFEALYQSCGDKKSERCADVMYTLSKLYSDQERDNYIQRRNKYEEQMSQWEKTQRGPEPANPRPDYSKSLNMYKRSLAMYPNFEKADEAYFQIGSTLMLQGDLDGAKKAFESITTLLPNSVRASAAHFRLADFCFMDRDFTCALKHIEQIKPNEVNAEVIEQAHYRRGEIYYNRAEFDKAAQIFYEYIEKCDAGEYHKKDLRAEALTYLSICFSDMPNGGQSAVDFFRRVGAKPYQDQVIYTVGMKNFEHGQYDQAIVSLQTALKSFPYYKEAPTAQQMLVACYIIKKKYDDANREREKLVDTYSQGSEWLSHNSSDPVAVESASTEVRRALSQIPVYYHAEAQKSKRKELFEKALQRYNDFFTRFPDDKWRIYEFKYNVAEIYNQFRDYEKAAECYDYVAQQNLATYPAYKSDVDTLGLDDEEKERQRKEAGKKQGPVAISQEDAGYNAIVALDNLRKQKVAAGSLTDEQAYAMPETKRFLDYIAAFQQRFPKSPTTPEVLYLAANVHYSAKAYAAAIADFQQIADAFPASPFAEKSMRMLANSYASTGEYEKALATYRQLLAKEKQGTPGYAEVQDLAAGALFKKADAMKSSGNMAGAAEAFKSVYDAFPSSKVAERAWFAVGSCYEELKNPEMAAATYVALADKFPASEQREAAFARAAEIYKNLQRWDDVGKTYETAATKGKKDWAPQALYNAGIYYEKAKQYDKAIRAYLLLASTYPQSEYAPEGFYSVGFCYEKLGKNEQMAQAFSEFAEKFPNDKSKQIMAYVRAGEAYFNAGNMALAEKNCNTAIDLYNQYKKKVDVDVEAAARAFFELGEIKHKAFLAISLSGKSEREVQNELKDKTKALEEALKAYASAIEVGVFEWAIRGTYMIGMSFVEMADANRDQTLFGSYEQKTASKIKIISNLEKFYIKAQDKFKWNVTTAYQQNMTNEWVDKSKDMTMKMAYLRGHLYEEIGDIFKSAPVPKDLQEDEKKAYKDVLEEKNLEALDAALPKYEEGVRTASDLGIASSEWLDKIKERVSFINPNSQVLGLKIEERKITPAPAPAADSSAKTAGEGGKNAPSRKRSSDASGQSGVSPRNEGTGSSADADYDRNVRRIDNISKMNLPETDKISQLRSIEGDANRDISTEEDRIAELKGKLGSK